jgi:hypothetical protein
MSIILGSLQPPEHHPPPPSSAPLQVPEHELFETVDLYEEKDMTVMLG